MLPCACRRRNVDQRRSPLGLPGGRGGRNFRTVRVETRIRSFRRSSSAMRSSPHVGFSFPMRRIRSRTCFGIRGRPGRDFRRQNSRQPARCQRIIVSGRTSTRVSCHLKHRESNASLTRVTGSMRRGFTPRSTYKACCRRGIKISAARAPCHRTARGTIPARSVHNCRTIRNSANTHR